jgi:hypothetical protein
MKVNKFYAKFRRNCYKLLLSLMESPRGCQTASILATVTVANHNFLNVPSDMVAAVLVAFEETAECCRGRSEVIECLKQWSHA